MKKKIFVRGPVLSQSGYGEQSRFALRALRYREDLFDIYIQPINYFFKAFSNDTDESIDIITGEELSPILNGFETRSIKTGKVDITRFNTERDTLNLNLMFYMTSGDLSSENKNYLNNDTSYSLIKFSNFYSYDDGEA